jgi:hypothetical protein
LAETVGAAGGAANLAAPATALDATGFSFIPAADSMASLSPQFADSLGVSGGLPGVANPADLGGVAAPTLSDVGTGALPTDSFTAGQSALSQIGDTASGIGSDALKYIGKNPLQAAGLGLGLKTALSTPKLPGSLRQVGDTNSALMASAMPIIQSGGTAAPAWGQQKASIDASIDQQIKDLTAQVTQNAINSGQGGKDSLVTQQQLQQMKQRLESQRQQLYQQQLAQNVQQAMQEISGGNQALTAIGTTQMQENQRAQQIGLELALQAAQLGQSVKGNPKEAA